MSDRHESCGARKLLTRYLRRCDGDANQRYSGAAYKAKIASVRISRQNAGLVKPQTTFRSVGH
jgi:hypothetical protein